VVTRDAALLDSIDRYYDTVPRASATVEEHGALTLFVSTGGWPYYARPRLGIDGVAVDARDVAAVLARQRELGVPEALEWVDEVTPSVAQAAVTAGLAVRRHPLLVLDAPPDVGPVPGITVRMAQADDPAIPAARAAIDVGFATGGTAVGDAGIAERDAALAERDGEGDEFLRARLAEGLSVMAIADSPEGPVGGGTASPRAGVAELTGIATLPASRRRGIGLAITAALTTEVHRRGVDLIFLSASDDAVARIYERAGFRRFATAGIAHRPRAL
jgi:GNAT superfamily N-acetyltransferase